MEMNPYFFKMVENTIFYLLQDDIIYIYTYIYVYIYIYAQRLGSAQALQRIYLQFTNK